MCDGTVGQSTRLSLNPQFVHPCGVNSLTQPSLVSLTVASTRFDQRPRPFPWTPPPVSPGPRRTSPRTAHQPDSPLFSLSPFIKNPAHTLLPSPPSVRVTGQCCSPSRTKIRHLA